MILKLALLLVGLFLAGCVQNGDAEAPLPGTPTETLAAASEPTQTPVVIVVTATPTATLVPLSPLHTPTSSTILLTATPAPMVHPFPITREEFAQMAARDLARRLNVSSDAITLEAAEPVSWPDASLGCPSPGLFYAQVIIPGYMVRLLYQRNEYHYHTDNLGPPFLCERLSAPLPNGVPPVALTATPTTVPDFPSTRTVVWPTLESLTPSAAAPGQQVVVIGYGGYVRLNGGYDESARSFDLYFDGSRVGSIGCYLNRCGGSFTVPEDALPESHMITTEDGSGLAIQVIPSSSLPTATASPPAAATPTPTATSTATPMPTPTAISSPPPPPTPTPTATITISQVVIQNVDLEAEVVTIANGGSAPQEMTGWTLISEVGGQVFRFPNGFTLAAGATVQVTSGPNGYSDPPAVLQWLNVDGTPRIANVWNNGGDPATLKNAAGAIVSRFP